MAPDLPDTRVYERPLSREELFASGYIQTQDRRDEFLPQQPLQPSAVQDPRHMDLFPSSPVAERQHMLPSSLDPQYAQQCPPFDQLYMEGFQTSPPLEQPRPPGGQYASSWGQEYSESPQPHYSVQPSSQMDQYYRVSAQPRMLDHQHEVASQGPVMPFRDMAANPDDPSVLLADARDMLDDKFYGPFEAIGDWIVQPIATHLSNGVTLVFEGVAAFQDLSDPMVHGVQQAASRVAGNLKTAADFVGVTMDFQRCPCGGSIPAGELYCPKCGAPRRPDPNVHLQDGGGATGSRFAGPAVPLTEERQLSGYSEGPVVRPPTASPVQPSTAELFASQTLQPQYPTYSGMLAERFPTLPRSATLDNSVKYARVLSETEVAGPGPLGSQSLEFTSHGLVRSPDQGIGAPPLKTMPAPTPMRQSSGFLTIPTTPLADERHLVAGGQTRTMLDHAPQGGLRFAAVVG